MKPYVYTAAVLALGLAWLVSCGANGDIDERDFQARTDVEREALEQAER